MLIRNAVGAVCHNNKKTKQKTIQNVLRTAFHQSMSVVVVYNLDSEYSKTKGKKTKVCSCCMHKKPSFFPFLAGGRAGPGPWGVSGWRALGPGAPAFSPRSLGPGPWAPGPWDLGPGPLGLGPVRAKRALARTTCSLYSTRLPLFREAASTQRGSLFSTRLGRSRRLHTQDVLTAQASTRHAAFVRV